MSTLIQPLESRRLFSVTAATLAADLSATKTTGAAVKTALASITKVAVSDLKSLKADLKGSASTSNKSLLKAVTTDENQLVSKLKADVAALLKAGTVAKRGAADGASLLKKSTAKLVTKVHADITALSSATAAPLATLNTDAHGSAVNAALTSLLSANTSNATLANDVAKTNSDNTTLGTAIVTKSQAFGSAVGALGTDLSALVA